MVKMRAAILPLLISLLCVTINGQAVVPQSTPFLNCNGKQFVMFGNDDVQALPIKTSTTNAAANYIHATHFNVTQPGVTINQLSFGILANPSITTVILLRLGLYQVTGTTLGLLAQSEEIQLYATQAMTIYADIPTTQLRPGTYAIASWANGAIYTGVGNTPTVVTSSYLAYNYYGLARSSIMSYMYGSRAVAARGCIDNTDPFGQSAGNQIYAMCATIQGRIPAPVNSWQYTMQQFTYVVSAMLAVSTSDTGRNTNGQWNKLLAAVGSVQVGKTGGYYYDANVAITSKQVTMGSQWIPNNNPLVYPNAQGKVDSNGVSFMSASTNEQFIITYSNGTYGVTLISPGSRDVLSGPGTLSTFSLTPVTDPNQPISCTPPSTFRSDNLNCPAGSVPVYFGDDDVEDNRGFYSSDTDYNYGNIVHMRPFKVNTQRTELRQISFQMNANPMKVIRMRMAVYSYEGAYNTAPTFTLLSETREVLLDNLDRRQVVAVNLQQPVELTFGKNYTLAFITDLATYSAYGYYDYWPVAYDQGYDAAMANGYARTLVPSENLYTVPLGGYGCAKQAEEQQVSFCTTFVYAGYSQIYSGTLKVISTVYTDPVTGQSYQQIVGGSGTSTQITSGGVTTTLPWTLHDMNLPTNNRLYTTGAPIDKYGIQIVINAALYSAYAVQIQSFYDPLSAETGYREVQQLFYSPAITGFRNLVSSFTVFRSGSPQCPPPQRPANTVTPASVARVTCPNNDRSITDTYGDSDVGNFAVNADGTLINANVIYTQRFTAEGSGVVRQLAVGILRNIDRPDNINVRLGLYAVANSSLITQTAQLTLYQAIDQLIIMNLPFAVNIVAGQSYMIALLASAPLEVATTATRSSPSMSYAFSSSGLPQTFASSGDQVGVSVAAYICVASTHSFCGSYQYNVAATGTTTTLIYQGLIQADPITSTNSYGTYRPVLAAGGHLIAYQRGPDTPTQSTTVFTFYQRLGTAAKLYSSSTNNMVLDNDGLQLSVSDGGYSSLVFNMSIDKMDESWRGDDKETDIVNSHFSVITLTDRNTPIPACGLQSIPRIIPTPVPLPTCPAGQSMVWYGDADNTDRSYNQEGVYYGEANHLYLRPFITDPGKNTIIQQVKFGISINYNTVGRIRMGLYDKNYKFMVGTEDVKLLNPHNEMFTGTLTQPKVLAANTLYYLALWFEYALYSGFTSGDAPATIVPFNGTWPETFVNTVPNSQRAVGGVGCTTDQAAPSTDNPSGSDSSSSSSSSLSKGGIAGVVIGVMIFTNLILLCLFCFCCMGATHNATKQKNVDGGSEHSRIN